MIYGYARVSPGGQSLDAQAEQLRAAGAAKVFREMVSGAKTDRAQLSRALAELEGCARAVANGVKMGRKPKLTPHQKREAIRRRDRGEDSLAEIGRSYNVSGWTISRLPK
jgi:DNA invertase Pin-like site-specific DNA recombinase